MYKQHFNERRGFTIVELLIVIVVIGILAAITVVAFNGIQNRGYKVSAQSDLSAFKKKMEIIKIDAADGRYPASIASSMGFSFSKSAYQTGRNNLYYCTSDDRTEYSFGVAVKPGNTGYLMTGSGQINEVNYGPGDGNTCALVVRAVGTGSQMGYSWNGTTGTWQGWTN